MLRNVKLRKRGVLNTYWKHGACASLV